MFPLSPKGGGLHAQRFMNWFDNWILGDIVIDRSCEITEWELMIRRKIGKKGVIRFTAIEREKIDTPCELD